MTRAKKIRINIFSSLVLQFITVIYGLVVPRFILSYYGSEVNGVISSITQFLGYIALLESGAGGVVKSALYSPLADKNNYKLSGIFNATNAFFGKIGWIFIGYVVILTMFFPAIVENRFDWIYTASLVVIIAIGTISQYFFGITNYLLLTADQKAYVVDAIQIATMVCNLMLSVLLMSIGCNVQIVKFANALIFVARPLITNYYVKKHYSIDKKVPHDVNSIKQRWDGFGQHIAFFIHSNTDIVVLSLFADMFAVSVYTVHMAVITGIKNLINSLANGFAPSIGDLIVRNEKDELNKMVNTYESLSFALVAILFSITAIMIEPFIMLFTKGISDTNYYQPLFSCLMCVSEGCYLIRNVYGSVIMGAGHFKQTQKGAYIEAVLNIIISVILVNYLGIVGVAIGTTVAMIYRAADYIFYLKKNILFRKPTVVLKKILVNSFAVLLIVLVSKVVMVDILSWYLWVLNALIVSTVATVIVIWINFIFNKDEVLGVWIRLKDTLRKRKV